MSRVIGVEIEADREHFVGFLSNLSATKSAAVVAALEELTGERSATLAADETLVVDPIKWGPDKADEASEPEADSGPYA